MTEVWKQIWEDLCNTLRRGETPSTTPVEPVQQETAHTPELATVSSIHEVGLADDTVNVAPIVVAHALENEAKDVPLVERPVSAGISWPERLRTGILYVLVAAIFFTTFWLISGNEWWARWRAPKPPADNVIATFEGGQLTIADVEAHLKQLIPEEMQTIARSPETFLSMVEDLVLDELVRRWAATRQPDKNEEFGHTMQHITENLNLESLDLQRHKNDIQVGESEIQAYYNENKAQFDTQTLDQARAQIREALVAQREPGYIDDYLQRLRDNASVSRNFELLAVPIPVEDDLRRYYDANLAQFKRPRQVKIDELQFPIVGDEAVIRRNADDALLKIRSGATFAEASRAISRTLIFTGTLLAEGMRDPAWDAAVFALTAGELSDVFRAGQTFYLVRLNELQPARTQTLVEVRAAVLATVQQQKNNEWFKANERKTLFTLKGKQYTVGQFYTEYTELPLSTQEQFAGVEGMQKLAEQLIERLLLVEDTYDQLLDVKNKPLVDEARLQVLKQMLHQEEIDDQIKVDDAAMQKYYNDNKARMAQPPKARIRYIRIGLGSSENEEKAALDRVNEAYRKLESGWFQQGTDFATVAQAYSEDPETAAKGGELSDWVGESQDVDTELQQHSFHKNVLSLSLNEISAPFISGNSFYIVQVLERAEAEPLTFEQAKSYIQDLLTDQKHQELAQALQARLIKQSKLIVYQSILENYYRQLPTPMPLTLPPSS